MKPMMRESASGTSLRATRTHDEGQQIRNGQHVHRDAPRFRRRGQTVRESLGLRAKDRQQGDLESTCLSESGEGRLLGVFANVFTERLQNPIPATMMSGIDANEPKSFRPVWIEVIAAWKARPVQFGKLPFQLFGHQSMPELLRQAAELQNRVGSKFRRFGERPTAFFRQPGLLGTGGREVPIIGSSVQSVGRDQVPIPGFLQHLLDPTGCGLGECRETLHGRKHRQAITHDVFEQGVDGRRCFGFGFRLLPGHGSPQFVRKFTFGTVFMEALDLNGAVPSGGFDDAKDATSCTHEERIGILDPITRFGE